MSENGVLYGRDGAPDGQASAGEESSLAKLASGDGER